MSEEKKSGATAARKVLRSRIEKQVEKEQEEQRREMLRKRIEIAKEGVKLYSAGNYPDALKCYNRYFKILEMWKKVSQDGITPELFDRKKDIFELILISGIYWDLAKLYDRSKTSSQISEMTSALHKFTMFSKGYAFQALSAEALRRYLGSGKCNHKTEFRKAYVALTGNKCFIVTALMDQTDSQTLNLLRVFRDEILSRSFFGRVFIRVYYLAGPALARITDFCPAYVRKDLGRSLDWVARRVS